MWDANGENIFEHVRLNPRASALSSITGGGSGPPTLGYVRWRGAKRKAPVLKHGARGGSLRPLKSPASPPSVNSVPEMLASPGPSFCLAAGRGAWMIPLFGRWALQLVENQLAMLLEYPPLTALRMHWGIFPSV